MAGTMSASDVYGPAFSSIVTNAVAPTTATRSNGAANVEDSPVHAVSLFGFIAILVAIRVAYEKWG